MPNLVDSILSIDFDNSKNRINQLIAMNSLGESLFSRNVSFQERSKGKVEIDFKKFSNGVY